MSSTGPNPLRVLVSGASISGLTIAYWLAHHGFDVTVVEHAPHLRPGGQALDVRGPALTVAERMGVLATLRERSTGLTGFSQVDADGKETFRSTERTLTGGRFESPDIEIMRDDLCRVLHEAVGNRVAYLFNDSTASLTQDASGVDVTFERAAPRRFELVVGADGLHSRVRKLAFGPEEQFLRRLGNVRFRDVVARSALPEPLPFTPTRTPGAELARSAAPPSGLPAGASGLTAIRRDRAGAVQALAALVRAIELRRHVGVVELRSAIQGARHSGHAELDHVELLDQLALGRDILAQAGAARVGGIRPLRALVVRVARDEPAQRRIGGPRAIVLERGSRADMDEVTLEPRVKDLARAALHRRRRVDGRHRAAVVLGARPRERRAGRVPYCCWVGAPAGDIQYSRHGAQQPRPPGNPLPDRAHRHVVHKIPRWALSQEPARILPPPRRVG
jgi:2-polyprenyl-6-methoxyphenol hydroxylase-like FAD-dependent oxidoreductase